MGIKGDIYRKIERRRIKEKRKIKIINRLI